MDAPQDISDLVAGWPTETAAVGVTDASATLAVGGDPDWSTRIASVTKLLVAHACLVALEEGSIDLDEPAGGRPGSTVRHLLAHASGLPFDGKDPVAAVGARRIYSNTGFERLGAHLSERTGMEWREYVRAGVLDPLGMDRTDPRGSPAHGTHTCVEDLLVFARELLEPRLVDPATLAEATTAQFPDLRGVVPGLGSFDPCPWGLGFEIKDGKDPHWTGGRCSPETFGHFGGAGTFLWVDPVAGLACVALTDREFDTWALEVWPPFSDAVLDRYGPGSPNR